MSARAFINIGIFVAGAAAGSLTTYFLVRDHFARIADEEIEDIRGWARERVIKIKNDIYEEEAVDSTNPEGYREMVERLATELATLTGGGVDVTCELEDYLEELYDEETSSVNPPDDGNDIRLITAADYIQDESYDTAVIQYHADENVFYDEAETEIPDEEIYILLGDLRDEVKNVGKNIYVRNESTHTDYEVIFVKSE